MFIKTEARNASSSCLMRVLLPGLVCLDLVTGKELEKIMHFGQKLSTSLSDSTQLQMQLKGLTLVKPLHK